MSLERRFRALAAFNAAIWTLLPCAFLPNMPVDTAELLYWARRPQWGYPKHPPMTYWVAGIFDRLAFSHLWGQYLAAQVCMLAAFWGVWKLACRFLDEGTALMATAVLQAVYFYGYMSPEFNHNVLILPFWAWTAYFFWRAASAGRTRSWIACGALAGLGFLVKYSFAALVFPLVVLTFFHPAMKKRLREPGPYLAALAALLAVSPHLLWLARGDHSTIAYAAGRVSPGGGPGTRLHHLAEFAVVQLAAVLPAVLIAAFAVRKAPKAEPTTGALAGAFLFAAAVGPFLSMAALCAIFGLRLKVNMYGSPLWIFAGLAVLFFMRRKPGEAERRRFGRALLPVYAFWLFVFAFQYAALPYLLGRAKRGHFPGAEISRRVHEAWKEEYGTDLLSVSGDPWTAGNVSIHSRSNPPVYTDVGDEFEDMRKNREKILREGTVIVWDVKKAGEELPARYREIFPEAGPRPPLEARWLTGASVAPSRTGWAVVPPTNMPQNSQKSVAA